MPLERLQDKVHLPLGENPWQLVMETCQDIAYIISPDGTYLEVNPRLCNVFHVPREKMMESTVTDRLVPDQTAVAKRILKDISQRKAPERSTRTYRISNTEMRTFEVMETPLIHSGEVWAIAGIGRDITQEVVLEQKLWDKTESRRTAVDFALRTSLGLIKGYIYTLRRYGDLNETQRMRYTQIIEEEIENLSRIIENILDVRRLENADLEMERDVVCVGECARLAIQHCADEAARKSVEIRSELPEKIDPLYAPKDALCRVLTNLVQNAVHHSMQNGRVTISMRDHETYIDISVRDNGVGIPESDLPYIFDKYYRGAGSAASASGGSGMGLAITRLLIEALGGRISVTSQVGKGSEFQLVLPRRPIDMSDVGETQTWTVSAAAADEITRA